MKVATTCLQLSLPHSPSSPSSSQTLASAISSPCSSSSTSSKRRSFSSRASSSSSSSSSSSTSTCTSLACRFVHPSSFFHKTTPFLQRSKSLEPHQFSSTTARRTMRRSCSASLDSFSDEEFAKKIEDLALRFQFNEQETRAESDSDAASPSSSTRFAQEQSIVEEPPWMEGGGEIIIPANIVRKANSVELPFSLRIIKKKLQWKEGFRDAGESACCSVKKAFSSMVFIIRELHSFTLHMREVLLYEDLQGILRRVQSEMHASFVWLFQQVFSHTPTLMVYVMILLANFTVHSMGHNAAVAAAVNPPAVTSEMASPGEAADLDNRNFDSSALKTFSVGSSSSGKKTAYVGGGNGGGGKFRSAASGTDGDGRFDRSDRYPGRVFPEGSSSNVLRTGDKTESSSIRDVKEEEQEEEEAKLWDSVVEEASRMDVGLKAGEGVLDSDTMKRFVSPVTAKMDSDDYAEYLRTELVYQTGLSKEPNNPLLLANYAQFLYLVAHDYDRAEEYFKRATEVEPKDAEAYNKYATFLWKVKNDLWAAEETYLEAISTEPTNSFYAANYAHFLWNTGAEDTCFPLSSPDTSQEV